MTEDMQEHGVLVGVVLMITSCVVLIMALYQALFATANSEKILTPIMPGVNIPWDELHRICF